MQIVGLGVGCTGLAVNSYLEDLFAPPLIPGHLSSEHLEVSAPSSTPSTTLFYCAPDAGTPLAESLLASAEMTTAGSPRYSNPPLPDTPTPLSQVLQPPSPRYSNPPLPGK